MESPINGMAERARKKREREREGLRCLRNSSHIIFIYTLYIFYHFIYCDRPMEQAKVGWKGLGGRSTVTTNIYKRIIFL
jgi:hypothetical protein